MVLKELKEINPTAYVRLIEFWADLNNKGFIAAKSDLILDMNLRFSLADIEGTFVLDDADTGNKFAFNKVDSDWKLI